MSITLSAQQKNEILAELAAGKPIEKILQLEDFTSTLEAVIREELAALDEPVFTNPTTGQAASSAFGILLALDYVYYPHWGVLARFMKKNGGDAVFTRTDLKKSSKWATICVDLNKVEELFSKLQVQKGPKIIAAFKEARGI